MCNPVSATIAAVGGLSTAIGASRQRSAMRRQERAQQEALARQEQTAANARKAEENTRRRPNYGALFDRNTIAGGVSSTVLTGAGGVTNGLSIGRNSLLGG